MFYVPVLTNSKLSSSFATSTTNIQEALNVSEWRKAMFEEMSVLEQNQTWKLEYSKGHSNNWLQMGIYTIDKTLERHNAWLVAKGFMQTYGIIVYCSKSKLTIMTVDMKRAFLNGRLEEEVYMFHLQGLNKNLEPRCAKCGESVVQTLNIHHEHGLRFCG